MPAVYPVQGDFATNPSYSGSFIPQLWSQKLNAKFYAKTMMTEFANSDYEGDIKNQGDTVTIRTAPTITIRDYDGPGGTLTSEVPTPITTDLQINKGKYFNVQVSDVLDYQADMDLMNMFTDDAAQQLKINIENDTLFDYFVTQGADADNVGANAGKQSGGYNLGTDVTPIDEATPENVLNAILAMASVLDEQDVPEEGRWLVMSPFDRNLLMRSSLAQAYFTGDSKNVYREGRIGSIDRFDVYVSNLLPRANAGAAFVPALTDPSTGGAVASAKKRRLMAAGTKAACTFASQINKIEPLRNQSDFGDLVRGLNVYGNKVIKPTALATAIVGSAT